MASPPPPDSNPRRLYPSVQSQSKPVYPSYHLEQTLPIPGKHRPTDYYKPLNILRSSPRPPILRLPAPPTTPMPSPAPRPVRAMEEFIAVVFEDEVWMGLVDFKSDKSLPEDNEVVHDAKRSSAILIPRTFRTPYNEAPVPMRVASRIYEEVELERRVEFDVSWNAERDDGYRIGSPPGPWIRKENLRERKDRKDIKEKGKDPKEKEKTGKKEKTEVGKERDAKRDGGTEVRKGQPSPTSVLHGYKYPIPQPKSILKQRTEPQSLSTSQQPHSLSKSRKHSGNASQQHYSPSTSSPEFKPYAEIPFVKQVRQPMDRQEVVSAGQLWSQTWKEQNIGPRRTTTISDSPPRPDPTNVFNPKKSTLSPTSTPFVPSNLRHSTPYSQLIISPAPRRVTFSAPHTAEQILGRLTPDSSLSQTLFFQVYPESSLSLSDSEEVEEDDWSEKISSPVTAYSSTERIIPAHLLNLKISLKTEIYSPHPAGAPTSSPSQAYSRITLIDNLHSPTLQYNTLRWSLPSPPREFDNRLYYPASLLFHTQAGTVEVDDQFTYMGDGRFWCGGIIVKFSSRRQVMGDVYMIKESLREELAWLEYIEGDIEQVEKWISTGEVKGSGDIGEVGQWRDESGKGIRRELRPEMFI